MTEKQYVQVESYQSGLAWNACHTLCGTCSLCQAHKGRCSSDLLMVMASTSPVSCRYKEFSKNCLSLQSLDKLRPIWRLYIPRPKLEEKHALVRSHKLNLKQQLVLRMQNYKGTKQNRLKACKTWVYGYNHVLNQTGPKQTRTNSRCSFYQAWTILVALLRGSLRHESKRTDRQSYLLQWVLQKPADSCWFPHATARFPPTLILTPIVYVKNKHQSNTQMNNFCGTKY